MENPLIRWLYSCNKIIKSYETKKPTHFMLDGGKIDISEDYDTFQEIYAKNIDYKNCIVELKTEIFKLFIDFDVLTENDFQINEYASALQDVIKDIYNKEFKCIITKANKDKKIKRDKEYIKKGFHFHWPDILVDKKTALDIRAYVVVRFNTIFGKVFSAPWDKIIDKCVYEHNGIRLIGADKCSISDGEKHYENRVYVLDSVYIGNRSCNASNNFYSDTLQLLKDTSIRSNEKTITEIINLPVYEIQEESLTEDSGFEIIKRDTLVYSSIVEFFNNFATGYYSKDIRKIIKIKNKEVYIIESKSKYCQNIQDFHTNNHVFFKLTPFGLCQKCRSERITDKGCCREYTSNPIPIPQRATIRRVLDWEMPKPKADIKLEYSISNILERSENNIIGRPRFSGPNNKKR